MDGNRLLERAAARAEELPGAELTHPFGPGWDVWKIRGRVFMLQTVLRGARAEDAEHARGADRAGAGEPIVTLKAAPADGRVLREARDDITPGYHMNKRHWITIHPGGGIDPGLVDDLVTESYLLVVEGLPRRDRPVDPATFGQRQDG